MSEFMIKIPEKEKVKQVEQKVVHVKQFSKREINYFKIALKVYLQTYGGKMVKGAGSEVVIEDIRKLFAKLGGLTK